MRHPQKTSRMERYVGRQIRGLSLGAWLLLVACMAMTGMFGWAIGRTLIEKVITGGGLATIDFLGALLIKACGTNTAERAWAGVAWSAIGAAICAVITFTSILGFQAGSRETQVATQQRALKVAEDFITYSKTTIMQAIEGTPKSKAAQAAPNPNLTTGIETLGTAVAKQIEMLKDGTLVVDSDGQATTLARIFHITEEQARSWMTALLAGAFLALQYIAQCVAGFMRCRVGPAVSALPSSGHAIVGGAQFGAQFGKFGAKLSKEHARLEVIRMLVTEDSFPSNVALARRWGVTTTVCHWLQDFRSEGHCIPPSPRGGRVGQRTRH